MGEIKSDVFMYLMESSANLHVNGEYEIERMCFYISSLPLYLLDVSIAASWNLLL